MKIIPNQDFKYDVNTYSRGVEYEVSDEEAALFIGAGWVGDELGNAPAEQSLDIHDMTLGHESEVN
jgi:hypothetical protein